MKVYEKLKIKIKTILSNTPENIEEDKEIYISENWELLEPREDGSRNIGTRNSLEAIYSIYDIAEPWLLKYPKAVTDIEIDESIQKIYREILETLVVEKFLRKSAKINRAQIKKVVDNNGKENI